MFKQLTEVQKALNLFLEWVKPLNEYEATPVEHALGRVCGEDIKANCDVPPFDRAAMDGYAVKSEETVGCSEDHPAMFKLVGRVEAGDVKTPRLREGEAVEVSTGARLPEGSDAVVPVEECRVVGGFLFVYSPVPKWKNVSRRGEDVRKGDLVVKKGAVIGPVEIGILSALGVREVLVYRVPRVGVLSVGDEVKAGLLRDYDKPMVKALVKEVGGEPIDLGVVGDDLNEIVNALRGGLSKADIVLTIGGTSVGKRDLVPRAIDVVGKPGVLVHGVSAMPGKPVALAVVNGKPVVALPGYPVSCFICFRVFVEPAIRRLAGVKGLKVERVVRARLAKRVASPPGVRSYVRVKLLRGEKGFTAHPVSTSGAGVLSSLVKGDGLLVVPEELEGFEGGEEVEIEVLREFIGE